MTTPRGSRGGAADARAGTGDHDRSRGRRRGRLRARDRSRRRPGGPSRYEFSTATVRFGDVGERRVADLYLPDRPDDPPVVVCGGSGFAPRSVLDAVGERLAAAGYAALAFDYRHHGDSDGEPRRLVAPGRVAADWEAAVAAARRLDGVAGARPALWGFSVGGGAALLTAAGDPRVRAVVARRPLVDGVAAVRVRGAGYLTRAVAAGLRDLAGSRLGRPYGVPLVPEGDGNGGLAALPAAAAAGLRAAFPAAPARDDAVPARSLLALARWRPRTRADRITCPALVTAGVDDAVAPPGSVVAAADAVPRATLVRTPGEHFDAVAPGPAFEEALGHDLAFLDRHLRG